MSASQPGLFNVQEFSDLGTLLAGGRLYTYAYGTTTFKAAYTDQAGTVPHTYTSDGQGGQYIALNVRGELPAPLYLAAGSYDIALKRADGSTVWTRRADPSSDASAAALAKLASSAVGDGAAMIGFEQPDADSIAQTLYDTAKAHLLGSQFGMVPDWDGGAGTNNASALLKALTALKQRGGGVLWIQPGDYYLGSSATSTNLVTIANLSNALIMAYGARFICTTTAFDATPFMVSFDSPSNVVLAGARFYDTGFSAAAWVSHDRQGAGAVRLDATMASSGFTLLDCVGQNLTYLLVGDFRANKNKLSNIKVLNCSLEMAYYGVDLLYPGDGVDIRGFRCKDVRRGAIVYGGKNVRYDGDLYCSSGFFGSNAFIAIECEGETYNDGNGVLGDLGNARDWNIRLNVSGFEAHESYVHFYHQQADSVGAISGVDALVCINNLSSAGKNGLIGVTNIYQIDHELPGGSIQASTQRTVTNVTLEAKRYGSITGAPIKVASENTSNPFGLALGPFLSQIAHTYAITQLTTCNYFTPFEKVFSLIPIGTTSGGSPAGLITPNGRYTKVGKRVFFEAKLTWSGHTGTGDLRLSGLPLPFDNTLNSGVAISVVADGLAHTANTTLVAFVGGAGNNQVLLYTESNGVLTAVPMDTAVSGLYVQGSYTTP